MYLLEVKNNNEFNSVYWSSGDFNHHNDYSAIKLKSLFDLLNNIIKSKNQYLTLPADDCTYD